MLQNVDNAILHFLTNGYCKYLAIGKLLPPDIFLQFSNADYNYLIIYLSIEYRLIYIQQNKQSTALPLNS